MSNDSESAAAEEDSSPPPVLAAVTTVLERLVARNEMVGSEESASGGGLAAFRAVRAPTISIGKYMERIYRYTGCSPSCFVVGFVYMDRAAHRNPGSLLVSLNVHRLIVTSLLIASKFLDDLRHYQYRVEPLGTGATFPTRLWSHGDLACVSEILLAFGDGNDVEWSCWEDSKVHIILDRLRA